jgi:hypothetical protein
MPSSQIPGALSPEVFAFSGTSLLWIFFWFGFIITLGFAFGLIYHWFRYGFMYPLAWVAIPVYSIGVLVLIGAMLTGIGTL